VCWCVLFVCLHISCVRLSCICVCYSFVLICPADVYLCVLFVCLNISSCRVFVCAIRLSEYVQLSCICVCYSFVLICPVVVCLCVLFVCLNMSSCRICVCYSFVLIYPADMYLCVLFVCLIMSSCHMFVCAIRLHSYLLCLTVMCLCIFFLLSYCLIYPDFAFCVCSTFVLIFTVSGCRVLVSDICYSTRRNNEIFLKSHQKENLCCLCMFMSDSMTLVADRNYVNVIRLFHTLIKRSYVVLYIEELVKFYYSKTHKYIKRSILYHALVILLLLSRY